MALLATQAVTANGVVPTYSAANATDTFVAAPNIMLLVENSNAATRTITLTTPATIGGNAIADPSNTIGATTGRLTFGGFNPGVYNDPTTGVCTITPSATAGVSYAVIQVAAL